MAQKITGYLKWLAKQAAGKVSWFDNTYSSHGFRHGVVDDLSIKHAGNFIVAIISRANWDWRGQVSKTEWGYTVFVATSLSYPFTNCRGLF